VALACVVSTAPSPSYQTPDTDGWLIDSHHMYDRKLCGPGEDAKKTDTTLKDIVSANC
jgi:hypothetical protein